MIPESQTPLIAHAQQAGEWIIPCVAIVSTFIDRVNVEVCRGKLIVTNHVHSVVFILFPAYSQAGRIRVS